MRISYLIRTNYFNHYSLRLLTGNILLTMPTLCVALVIGIWGKLDFLLILPVTLSMGILLVFPSTTTIARPSKERVAADALTGGLAMMVLLCCVLVIATPLQEKEHVSKDPSFLGPKGIVEEYDPKEFGAEERNSKVEGLG